MRNYANRLCSVSVVLGVAVLMTGCAARAQGNVLVSPNEDGGQITLTMRDCVTDGKNFTQEYPTLRQAYTFGTKTPYLEGCWTLIDGNVHVVYFHNNTRRVYPLSGFTRR